MPLVKANWTCNGNLRQSRRHSRPPRDQFFKVFSGSFFFISLQHDLDDSYCSSHNCRSDFDRTSSDLGGVKSTSALRRPSSVLGDATVFGTALPPRRDQRETRFRIRRESRRSPGDLSRIGSSRPAVGGRRGPVCLIHEVMGCGAITPPLPPNSHRLSPYKSPQPPPDLEDLAQAAAVGEGGGRRSGTGRRSRLRWTTSSGGGQTER